MQAGDCHHLHTRQLIPSAACIIGCGVLAMRGACVLPVEACNASGHTGLIAGTCRAMSLSASPSCAVSASYRASAGFSTKACAGRSWPVNALAMSSMPLAQRRSRNRLSWSGSRSPATIARILASPVVPVMVLNTWVHWTCICCRAFGLCWIGMARCANHVARWHTPARHVRLSAWGKGTAQHATSMPILPPLGILSLPRWPCPAARHRSSTVETARHIVSRLGCHPCTRSPGAGRPGPCASYSARCQPWQGS
jgi:hypothetical protein